MQKKMVLIQSMSNLIRSQGVRSKQKRLTLAVSDFPTWIRESVLECRKGHENGNRASAQADR